MENTTNINITGNNNTVIVGQSNEVSNGGCGLSGCGCNFWIFLIFIVCCIAPLCNRSYPDQKTDIQKWFQPYHYSHSNQIDYRKSCQLCKDELCNDILEEHIMPNYDLNRVHFSDSTKEKCPICKFNLRLNKSELKKLQVESQKPIQYLPLFFEEYPMIDNDIIPWGCRSIKWIEKQKAMAVKIFISY